MWTTKNYPLLPTDSVEVILRAEKHDFNAAYIMHGDSGT